MLTQLSSDEIINIYVTAPIAMCSVDRDGRYILVNHAYAAILGLTINDFKGRYVRDFFAAAAVNVAQDIAAFDRNEAVPDHEIEILGRTFYVSVCPIGDERALVKGLSVSLTDISKPKALERELSATNQHLVSLARIDPLTGLANRRAFEDGLREAVARCWRDRGEASLLLLDVDYFKRYNDCYGHPAGDDCLERIALSIKRSVRRPADLAARIGGEEFAIVLPETGLAAALQLAEAIRETIFALAVAHKGNPHGRVSASVGAASLAAERYQLRDDQDPVRIALVNAADHALYLAKKSGRNCVRSACIPVP